MYFSQEAIDQLAADYGSVTAKRLEVCEALLSRAYEVPRAREFAVHGVSRRLRTMSRCIEKVFTILPPEREDQPSMDELVDGVVHIQAFIFNSFACIDNLAWIWVCERTLTSDKGESIPPAKIGFGRKCRLVRRSLPADLRNHLKLLNPWFDHLENFRHALAHRIPLYVPPGAVLLQDIPKYELLGRQMAKALRRRNAMRYENLLRAQAALERYQPEMLHSPEDKTARIVFHPQLLSDFKTICDLAMRLNAALDTEKGPAIKRRFWRRIFDLRELFGRAWSCIGGQAVA